MIGVLPAGFESLSPLVEKWALPTERARHRTRLTSQFSELQSLYQAVQPLLEGMVAHLKQFDVDAELPVPEQNLLNLALAFMEVALPVEAHGQSTVPGGFDHERFEVVF